MDPRFRVIVILTKRRLCDGLDYGILNSIRSLGAETGLEQILLLQFSLHFLHTFPFNNIDDAFVEGGRYATSRYIMSLLVFKPNVSLFRLFHAWR